MTPWPKSIKWGTAIGVHVLGSMMNQNLPDSDETLMLIFKKMMAFDSVMKKIHPYSHPPTSTPI